MSDNQDPWDKTNSNPEPSDWPAASNERNVEAEPDDQSLGSGEEDAHLDPLTELDAEPSTQSLDPDGGSPFVNPEDNPNNDLNAKLADELAKDDSLEPNSGESATAAASQKSTKQKASKSRAEKAPKAEKVKKSKKAKPPKEPKSPKPKQAKQQNQSPKNRRTSTVLISVLITLLVLAAIAAALWFFVFQPKEDPAQDETPTITSEEPELTPETSAELIIDEIQKALHEDLDELYEDMKIGTHSPDSAEPLAGPAYQVGEEDYLVRTNKTYGLDVTRVDAGGQPITTDSEFPKTVRQTIDKTLLANNYKKANLKNLSETIYETDAVICSYDGESPLVITCADKSAYQTVNESVKPFYVAYQAADVKIQKPLILGLPSSSDSQTEDYELAEVSIGNAMGLFYRKTGADWQYFTSTQNMLSCDAFKDAEVQRAYAHEQCINPDIESNKPTTVSEYFNS